MNENVFFTQYFLCINRFTVANEDEFEPELQAVKLDDSGVDVNVVWYDKNRVKYVMEPVDDFDGSDLRKFVHQVQDGNNKIKNQSCCMTNINWYILEILFLKYKIGLIKPVWKSQPIPKKQEGPVVNLVADNFESEVLTPPGDRDVLFYIYAPWLV
jgi:hypothetical protein